MSARSRKSRFPRLNTRRARSLRGWILPLAFGLVAVGALALAWTTTVRRYPEIVSWARDWSEAHRLYRSGVAAAPLFDDLVARKLIGFEPASGELRAKIDCGAERAGMGPEHDDVEERRRVERFCQSDVGRAIDQEMELWNRGLIVLAVRDNSDFGGDKATACDDATPINLFIPGGCHKNRWAVAFGSPEAEALSPPPTMPAEPPGEVFGFFSRPPPVGMGDWAWIDEATVGGKKAFLRARFEPRRDPLIIDVIGDDVKVTVNGAAGPDPTLLCERASQFTDCRARIGEDPDTPRGWRVTLQIDKTSLVIIAARPAKVKPAEIRKLGAVALDTQPEGRPRPDQVTPLTRSLSLVCELDRPQDYPDPVYDAHLGSAEPTLHERKFCEPAWRPSLTLVGSLGVPVATTAETREPRGEVTIRAVGGGASEALTAAREIPAKSGWTERRFVEEPTKAAIELGLASVVGIGEADRYSLLGQAARRVRPGDKVTLDLTIDPTAQRIAQDEIDRVLARAPGTETLTQGFIAKADSTRRASIVLMDAGVAGGGENGGGFDTETGQILAAAAWPRMRANLSHWDVLATEDYKASESELAARSWAETDSNFAPGSTFKTVIALTGIDRAAHGDERIERALGLDEKGGLTASEMAQAFGPAYGFGFHAKTLDVPVYDGEFSKPPRKPRAIHNAEKDESVCSVATGGPCSEGGRVGLDGALTHSNNVWFARLALLLDDDKVTYRDGTGPILEIGPKQAARAGVPLSIEQTLERLWPSAGVDLAPGFTDLFGSPPLKGTRTYATPIPLDATLLSRPRRLSLALNGIGQAMQASPLAMATVMTSVATGKIVRPRLTLETPPNTELGDLIPTKAAPGQIYDASPDKISELLTRFRRALHHVVTQGTASAAFTNSPLRDRIFGKTGTATTAMPDEPRGGDQTEEAARKKEGVNNVWFVGWIDGLRKVAGGRRRVAFACIVTHIRSGDTFFGGSVCAPMIEKVLRELDRDGP